MGESKMPARIGHRRWIDNEIESAKYIRADLVEPLVEALRIIAGRQQCIDNLMSNADVARAALSSWEVGQ